MKRIFTCLLFFLSLGAIAQHADHKKDTTFKSQVQMEMQCQDIEGTDEKQCTFFYEPGKVFQVGRMRDTLPIGNWVSYYKNGSLRDSVFYEIVDLNGVQTSVLDTFAFYFYGNGAIRERGLYRSGRKHGQWISYFTDGREKSRLTYVYGIEQGDWRANYRDGKLREKGQFENGLKTGEWFTYLKDGSVWGNGKYHLNYKQGLWTWNHRNGNLQTKGSYERGDRDGEWMHYHKNGELEKKGNYEKGKENGFWQHYFDTGELEAEGFYKQGVKDSLWKERFRDQKSDEMSEFIHGHYEYGKKDSSWFTYFENGNPKEMWTFKSDILTGIHKEFYPNGQLKTSHAFLGGVMLQTYGCYTPEGEFFECGTLKRGTGKVVVLDDDGTIIREDYYEDGVRKKMAQDH